MKINDEIVYTLTLNEDELKALKRIFYCANEKIKVFCANDNDDLYKICEDLINFIQEQA